VREDAEAAGIHTVRIEAPEGRSLPSLLAPQLRQALLRLSQIEKAKDFAVRGLRALAGFAKMLKVTYADIEVGFDYEPEPGLADNGDLEHDLQALFEQVGLAAKAGETALAIFIDELQYVEEPQLAVLITAMHRTEQRRLPVVLVGAGQYAYFLQEWGSHTWLAAKQSPILPEVVRQASVTAIAALDESFFRVRFDRLTPKEKKYLRAMAELGPGPHRSGDIAESFEAAVSSLAPTRSSLIAKGMVWSPNHGDTAFTVPMFDEFMKRIMPGDSWR
jgi:hypothetical protein